jgi:hypothetical protein
MDVLLAAYTDDVRVATQSPTPSLPVSMNTPQVYVTADELGAGCGKRFGGTSIGYCHTLPARPEGHQAAGAELAADHGHGGLKPEQHIFLQS